MKITALAGGIGGARFLMGLREHAQTIGAEVTAIINTGDDIWVHGVRVCPDLDSVMYTLGDGISKERGWGREDETFTVKEELAAYGVEPTWFGLGDRDLATHLVRTQALDAGFGLAQVTQALCDRWQPGMRLLPMSNERAETHVIVDDPDTGERRAIHFQEWWIRHRASLPAFGFPMIGIAEAMPAPGVLEAIEQADVIVVAPSNPVVSIGTILQVPGLADALKQAKAPIVGVSPIIGGAPVRGMADACLTAIGVPTTAHGVAANYAARAAGGLLDAWLVDEQDASEVASVRALGMACEAIPLFMTDVPATAFMAASALEIAMAARP